MKVDLPEPLPPVRITRSPELSVKLNGPTLNTVSADLAGIVEFDVAHFDLAELLRGLGRNVHPTSW